MIAHTARAQLRLKCQNKLGEEPVWHADTQTLYWVDTIIPGWLHSYCPASGETTNRSYDQPLLSLALRSNGDLLVAGTKSIRFWSANSGLFDELAAIEPEREDNRINCMACDPAGNLWVASMQNNVTDTGAVKEITEFAGALYRIDVTGNIRKFDRNFACPNTMVWSPQGDYFYLGDSATGWIYRYEYDQGRAEIGSRTNFFRAEELGVPDGSAIDADGYIWNARWGASCVIRISPTGEIVQRVDLDARQPSCCVFGGNDGKTLFITTARFGMDRLSLQECDGGLFSFDTQVGGAGVHHFGG